jgi:hypothetical protein
MEHYDFFLHGEDDILNRSSPQRSPAGYCEAKHQFYLELFLVELDCDPLHFDHG